MRSASAAHACTLAGACVALAIAACAGAGARTSATGTVPTPARSVGATGGGRGLLPGGADHVRARLQEAAERIGRML